MTRITSRFVLLIATAAVAPLVIYGFVSMERLRDGTHISVREGNLRVAEQVAEQLKLYIDNNARILRSLAQELTETDLAAWQQTRILRNHVLEFPEFREISLLAASGRAVATSRVGSPEVTLPPPGGRMTQGVRVAPIFQDVDLLPTTDLALRITDRGDRSYHLVARLSLEELWRLVDRMRVGREGYALVFSEERRLVAHGNPARKRLVAIAAETDEAPPEGLFLALRESGDETYSGQYEDEAGRKHLASIAPVPDLNWTVMVEQPEDEAYAVAIVLQRQLIAAIALALLGTVTLGWIFSHSIISRIAALTAATQALAAGRMTERVAIGGNDEIRQLGDSFNAMADRLVELQEDVRRQERQAMFGKVAAGLVHDLSHPIQNIGNNCKLIVRMYDDTEYRETFRRTVDRELLLIQRVLDDLRNIARPIPLQRFPIDVNRSVAEAVESMKPEAEAAGISLAAVPPPEVAIIEGDALALGRVYRNLMTNAIQATAPGGSVTVEIDALPERVRVRIRDTGCGIPPDRLAAIFEDFVTTKRRGLGLGLAISRKIVEQLGGQIAVTSEVGVGTTFTLEFPRAQARPMLVAG